MSINNPSRALTETVYRANEDRVHHTYKPEGKKVQMVHSLAPALTLTLALTLAVERVQLSACVRSQCKLTFEPQHHRMKLRQLSDFHTQA